MILRRVGRSHRKGLHSGRKAARLSCFARGSYKRFAANFNPATQIKQVQNAITEGFDG